MARITKIKVRVYHLDLYGHVNHARYLEMMEDARWQFVEDMMKLEQWETMKIDFVVVNINLDFKHPALLHDVLSIESKIESIGNKSMIVNQVFTNKITGKTIANGNVTLVLWDKESQRARLITDDIRKFFTAIS